MFSLETADGIPEKITVTTRVNIDHDLSHTLSHDGFVKDVS